MISTPFISGVSRVLNCPKVHVAVTGLVTTWFAVRYATADLPPTQRASLWVAFIAAVAVQLREIINAWTEEDVAAGQIHQRTDADAETSGSGQDGKDAPANKQTAAALFDSRSQRPGVSASMRPAVVQPKPANIRSIAMPPRTKLPVVLIAFSTIALFASGCQTPPEVTGYREGLHQVDEPLYQAHLLLLDDAVKANLRTDADRQVVKQGIAAAEGLYQQSKATEAAGLPTTTATH